MGNIFDPKRIIQNIHHKSVVDGKDNLSFSVPNSKTECIMLINGYMRKAMDTTNMTQSIIPMDIIHIIGIFHPYLNMIERRAVEICKVSSNSVTSFPRQKTYYVNKSIRYLIAEYNKLSFVKNQDPNATIVHFFYHQRQSLDKQTIGAYFHSDARFKTNNDMIKMMKEYLQLFDFKHKSIVTALREFIERCSLPSEAQKIDHIMQLFAEKYYNDYRDKYDDDMCVDDVYILGYSIIMLNCSIHNKLVRNPMTKVQFMRNSKMALSTNAAMEMLDDIYDRVKAIAIT